MSTIGEFKNYTTTLTDIAQDLTQHVFNIHQWIDDISEKL